MQVGTDTYVTVTEADAYVASRYRSTSAALARWLALSPGDKETLLLDACVEMERLPFHGRKVEDWQTLSFPRRRLDGVEEVPANVKSAQVELALWLSDDAKKAELDQRQALRAQGVTSFSVGDLSETYSGTSVGSLAMLCPRARTLLSAYLNGAYATI